MANTASRLTGRGEGEIIGGRVALRLAPSLLASLARGRRSVLVTGTNGKSTVTSLVAAALSAAGPVVSNRNGGNMPDGIVHALALDHESRLGALEVDEVYLGPVAAATAPAALLVLNASREYTRGISLARTLAHWRSVASTLPAATAVVANVDDPLVQWAFEAAPQLVPVAGGLGWTADALMCPGCQAPITDLGADWACTGCDRRRRPPVWSASLVEAGRREASGQEALVVRSDRAIPVTLSVPGRTAAVNAMFALAAADALGVDLDAAAASLAAVIDVDGRYRPFDVAGRRARILMLKNPAGWTEAIDTVVRSGHRVVIAFEPFGPRDTTTLWEAPWDRLRGHPVTVSGTRALDVLSCLEASGVAADHVPDPVEAVRRQPPGEVVLACNYPAFRQLRVRLRSLEPDDG
jgi:lipid II isoglutaminyl synthase (glutamine-hydrolysing)